MDPWFSINDMLMNKVAAELLAEEEAAREKHWHIFAKRTEVTEDKFKPKLVALFDKQEKSVIGKLKGKPIPQLGKHFHNPLVQLKVNNRWFLTNGYDPIETPQGTLIITHIDFCIDGEYSKADYLIYGKDPFYATSMYYDSFNFSNTETIHEGSGILKQTVSNEAEAAAEAYVATIFAPVAWHVQFQNTALPFVTEAFAEAGAAVFTEVGVDVAFNVTSPAAKKILETRVFKFAQEVNETTQARLRSQLAYAFDAGESIPQIEKRVANVFDIAKGSRTNMIARTEIVGASNRGSFQGYIDSKVVETKIWVDSRDALVRDSHRIDGEERRLRERFSNGLMHPHDSGGPAELVINCRCTTAAGKLKAA